MTLTQNYRFVKVGLETEICSDMKFGSDNKSNMLIMNIILTSV